MLCACGFFPLFSLFSLACTFFFFGQARIQTARPPALRDISAQLLSCPRVRLCHSTEKPWPPHHSIRLGSINSQSESPETGRHYSSAALAPGCHSKSTNLNLNLNLNLIPTHSLIGGKFPSHLSLTPLYSPTSDLLTFNQVRHHLASQRSPPSL